MRTVTLPTLTLMDISAAAMGCGLALSHLVLPALTQLVLMARSQFLDGTDTKETLMLLDMRMDPRIPNRCRAYLSDMREGTPTSLSGPPPISAPRCATRLAFLAPYALHASRCLLRARLVSQDRHRNFRRGDDGPPPSQPLDVLRTEPHRPRRASLAPPLIAVAHSTVLASDVVDSGRWFCKMMGDAGTPCSHR